MLGSVLSGSAGFVDGFASVAFGSDSAMMCESGCGFLIHGDMMIVDLVTSNCVLEFDTVGRVSD